MTIIDIEGQYQEKRSESNTSLGPLQMNGFVTFREQFPRSSSAFIHIHAEGNSAAANVAPRNSRVRNKPGCGGENSRSGVVFAAHPPALIAIYCAAVYTARNSELRCSVNEPRPCSLPVPLLAGGRRSSRSDRRERCEAENTAI